MDWKQKLGEQIRRARARQGMTQHELRAALKEADFELSVNSIGHYERGERAPGIDDLRKIAFALKADRFEIDENLRIEFSKNGKARPEIVPQQLTLAFDDKGGVTVRIESAREGLIIKKNTA
ncbi:MAG: helix-turn-helix domain-containing protein [Acidobacteriia bacterium]|nr:helix-turn-helix domain-containing protein [Terriglobia bacterium]